MTNTSVFAFFWNLNLLSKYTNAIFASMSANRIPIQDRGPVPNGRKQYGLRFCFASFENLPKIYIAKVSMNLLLLYTGYKIHRNNNVNKRARLSIIY